MPARDEREYPLRSLLSTSLWRQVDGSVWDLERMWGFDAPVESVSVESLRWHLSLPFWRHGEEMFAASPNEVRERPRAHGEQLRRTLAADLDCPLIALRAAAGPLVVDGLHRLLKADLLGRDEVELKLLEPAEF